MNRLTRNVAAFTFGLALVAGIARCAEAHVGDVLDHEDVSHRLFCSAVYGWVGLYAYQIDDQELLIESRDRSNRALAEAKFYARLHKHSDLAFDAAASDMFLRVGDTHPEDASAFFEYLDCESLTEESAPL